MPPVSDLVVDSLPPYTAQERQAVSLFIHILAVMLSGIGSASLAAVARVAWRIRKEKRLLSTFKGDHRAANLLLASLSRAVKHRTPANFGHIVAIFTTEPSLEGMPILLSVSNADPGIQLRALSAMALQVAQAQADEGTLPTTKDLPN